MAKSNYTAAERKAFAREFLAVGYGKKMTWLRKHEGKFSMSCLYRWVSELRAAARARKPKKKSS